MGLFRRFIIIAMTLDFLALASTGIVKFPELKKRFLFVYDLLSASSVSMIHDWSGVILIALIILHLILKRDGLRTAFFNWRSGSGEKGSGRIFMIAVLSVLAVGAVLIVSRYRFAAERPVTHLSAVEIKEYQGEKLGSIEDFRENSIKGPQRVDRESYRLEVNGLVDEPASFSYEDVLRLPTYDKVVTLNCVEGWSVKALWEGVLVRDILSGLGAKPEADTIVFYAVDGYSTSFPLSFVMDNDIILASKINGMDLPEERGFPFQLVAEDKWGYKWIKWVTGIELSDDPDYKGYWESRGYSNDGSLGGSKFEAR